MRAIAVNASGLGTARFAFGHGTCCLVQQGLPTGVRDRLLRKSTWGCRKVKVGPRRALGAGDGPRKWAWRGWARPCLPLSRAGRSRRGRARGLAVPPGPGDGGPPDLPAAPDLSTFHGVALVRADHLLKNGPAAEPGAWPAAALAVATIDEAWAIRRR